jgi:hypothetical protein
MRHPPLLDDELELLDEELELFDEELELLDEDDPPPPAAVSVPT